MMATAEKWLQANDFGTVTRHESLGGGSICSVSRLHLDNGMTVVLKTHSAAPECLFQAEADGLKALAAADCLHVPAVLHWTSELLLLEDLGQAAPGADYWQTLGRGLAELHSKVQSLFGFHRDTYCGTTRQINTPTDSGYEFFANYRLLALARKAFDKHLLNISDMRNLEYIANNLAHLIPDKPAVLIHGDLWSGNIHCDQLGNPALIDPAAYWGWAEADLAMTRLFGGFDQRFYDSYREATSLEFDWEQRADIYNLYHLLNHVLLFGGGYVESVRKICARFC